jgi:anti-sigma-K factor RskA
MTHEPPFEDRDRDDSLLAAEYVLGLGEPDERRALGRRVEEDPAFAREVAFWEVRLGSLANSVKPVPAPAWVWNRIEQELGRVVPRPTTEPRAPGGPNLWDSLTFWRGFSAVSGLVAAVCLVIITLHPFEPVRAPMVATLMMDDGRSGFMVSVDPMNGKVMLMPAAQTDMPPEHTNELWIITDGGPPQSLGTFTAKGPVTITVSPDMMPPKGMPAKLAVSVEPMGGSPTGKPSGPMLASGDIHGI